MSPLEARYRRLLCVLPRAYREARAEEMVDTFLLTMHEDDPEDDVIVHLSGRPSFSERLSVLSLALRLRWGGTRAPVRYQVHGGAVRWCVTLIVLIQATVSAQLLLAELWLSALIHRP